MEVKISAVILTLNEERNIGRCLDSLIGIADDIVVVDSFSNDQTEAICAEKGVRFVKHKFEGYIEQKNWAITQAEYPHVISLDADEALSDELKESVLQAKKNWQFDGYSMNRLTNYCGKWIHHCAWYPDRKLRLWDSRKGMWTGINPHDEYKLQQGTVQSHLKGDLLHYSYYTISQHVQQADKFTDITSKAMYRMGKRASWVKILISPPFKFFRNYIMYRGFLDGYYGFVVCKISAFTTYLKYTKLKDLWRRFPDGKMP